MAKGASIKFESYDKTIPKLLSVLKLERGFANSENIVLKPFLIDENRFASIEFIEPILKYCLTYKKISARVFIAEGADGYDTIELFRLLGYKKLAEKYNIGLIDLNEAETEEIEKKEFLRFNSIKYPLILSESFVISLSKLEEDEELGITGSVASMLGAFPAREYRGFFSKRKSKIHKWPLKYGIHDIYKCKVPDFAVIDASEKGFILAGLPLDIDKAAAKILGKEWKHIPYIKLIEENQDSSEKSTDEENSSLEDSLEKSKEVKTAESSKEK